MGEQWTEDRVKSATPEQIVAAQEAGELVHYLGGKTPDEIYHDQTVAGTPDRISAAAYGLSVGQAKGGADLYSGNWFEAKRKDMDAAQLEKLDWVESASPAEVYEAEQAGQLNHLLGIVVSDPAQVAQEARLEEMRTSMAAIYNPTH